MRIELKASEIDLILRHLKALKSGGQKNLLPEVQAIVDKLESALRK